MGKKDIQKHIKLLILLFGILYIIFLCSMKNQNFILKYMPLALSSNRDILMTKNHSTKENQNNILLNNSNNNNKYSFNKGGEKLKSSSGVKYDLHYNLTKNDTIKLINIPRNILIKSSLNYVNDCLYNKIKPPYETQNDEFNNVSYNITPEISVIISVYNQANLITQLIRSIQKQTFKDYEIIIIDDHSNDNTIEIIHHLMKEDSRIKLFINEERKGVIYSKSRAVFESKGKFIMPIDPKNIFLNEDLFKICYDLIRSSHNIKQTKKKEFKKDLKNFLKEKNFKFKMKEQNKDKLKLNKIIERKKHEEQEEEENKYYDFIEYKTIKGNYNNFKVKDIVFKEPLEFYSGKNASYFMSFSNGKFNIKSTTLYGKLIKASLFRKVLHLVTPKTYEYFMIKEEDSDTLIMRYIYKYSRNYIITNLYAILELNNEDSYPYLAINKLSSQNRNLLIDNKFHLINTFYNINKNSYEDGSVIFYYLKQFIHIYGKYLNDEYKKKVTYVGNRLLESRFLNKNFKDELESILKIFNKK